MNNFFTFLFAFILGVTAQQIMASGRLDTLLVVPLLLSLFFVGLLEILSLKDRKITGDEARRIAEKWGKWKGLASFYLIVADMLEQDR